MTNLKKREGERFSEADLLREKLHTMVIARDDALREGARLHAWFRFREEHPATYGEPKIGLPNQLDCDMDDDSQIEFVEWWKAALRGFTISGSTVTEP